ncbi:hypothetical protein A6V39_01125 [Candidatus Mycoplasma haematobovis]|uniref:Uncharacterized protein n=1 Tax=Candidatus Mycoplasma haematobovis TaxID=432608 RepID=A0A1A9QFB2_9MOLU|nr:hypothetical protein [Candidatus Mycoplasma haematobovis]OAL10655.1 hypothetical protein A6V39_01125 [Candidatus Mycoplasma haematobovis]
MSTFPIKVALADKGIYYLLEGSTKTATKPSTSSQPTAIKSLFQATGKPILTKEGNVGKWNKSWKTFNCYRNWCWYLLND